MQARLKNPAEILPEMMPAVLNLMKVTKQGGVPEKTMELVHLRVSQINGCSVCMYGGAVHARKAGETDDRLFTVAAWRDAPFFTEPERAALALAEATTRIADRGDAVPDEIWNEAKKHYDERGLAALILMIGMVNLFNRMNAATRQPAGATW